MDENLAEILEQIYIALERLKAEAELLEAVENFGSGLTDDEVLERLKQINLRAGYGPWHMIMEER